VAFGIKVPKPLGDFMVLETLYATKGIAVAVSDAALLSELQVLGAQRGAGQRA
jgi:threonine synthase